MNDLWQNKDIRKSAKERHKKLFEWYSMLVLSSLLRVATSFKRASKIISKIFKIKPPPKIEVMLTWVEKKCKRLWR